MTKFVVSNVKKPQMFEGITMNKQMEMIDILQHECRKDSELFDMIVEEYVLGLNAFEEANLEDFIVNNFGDL